MWSEAVHWVQWLWGLPGGIGQDQPPPVFYLGPSGMSYKAICRWLLLVLSMEVPRQDQPVKQCWLLLVLGQGPLSERPTSH